MTGSTKGIFAIIVVSGIFVLAVSLCDISIEALAAAWTFKQSGENMRMIYVVNLFP